jgi:hypothetical protein
MNNKNRFTAKAANQEVNSFQRNIFGNFDKDASMYAVLYGTDSYLLEDELNESQWAAIEKVGTLMRSAYISGFTKDYDIVTTQMDNTFFIQSKDKKPLSLLIDGYQLDIGANNPEGLSQYLSPSDDKLMFKLTDSFNEVDRTDLIILECWFEVISYEEDIYKFGGVDTPKRINHMLDPRMSEETSRRVQFRWRLRTLEGRDSIDNIEALTYQYERTGILYKELDNGVMFADIGPVLDEDNSMKTGKLNYAVPLFKVRRPKGINKIILSDITTLTPISNMGVMNLVVERNLQVKGDLDIEGTVKATTETFVYQQMMPAKEWIIEHNLKKFPSVTVVDRDGIVVIGDIKYNSNNLITISFSKEFIGKAYLN